MLEEQEKVKSIEEARIKKLLKETNKERVALIAREAGWRAGGEKEKNAFRYVQEPFPPAMMQWCRNGGRLETILGFFIASEGIKPVVAFQTQIGVGHRPTETFTRLELGKRCGEKELKKVINRWEEKEHRGWVLQDLVSLVRALALMHKELGAEQAGMVFRQSFLTEVACDYIRIYLENIPTALRALLDEKGVKDVAVALRAADIKKAKRAKDPFPPSPASPEMVQRRQNEIWYDDFLKAYPDPRKVIDELLKLTPDCQLPVSV